MLIGVYGGVEEAIVFRLDHHSIKHLKDARVLTRLGVTRKECYVRWRTARGGFRAETG
jgi:hypothetical protein